MRLRPAVASGCFLFPLAFEMYTKLGAFECSEPFMRERLAEGFDVAIMPGGAVESRYAHGKGSHILKLGNRKGFVRVALEVLYSHQIFHLVSHTALTRAPLHGTCASAR